MQSWAARVADAAAAWVYVPDGAPHAVGDEYAVVAYPESWTAPTQVARVRSSRPPDVLVPEVEALVAGWDRPTLDWWIDPLTTPVGLEAWLRDHGAEHVETVTVLAVDLTRPLPDFAVPPGVTAVVAETSTTLRGFGAVNAAGWESPEPSEDDVARWGREREMGSFRVLGSVDGVPCATGGLSLVDGVARLWAGVTLPAYRGRGAYRAVLAERLRVARAHGATIGLVKGRVTTSAPILRRLGFDVFDDERAYRKVTAAGDGNSANAS